MSKDKKKEKTLEKVRKDIGLQMQDRRNLLNLLLNIENSKKSISLIKDQIDDMKVQLNSGSITEKQNGIELSKKELERKIVHYEFTLKQAKLNLDFQKEDMFYLLNVNEGAIQKAGSLELLKEKIKAHFSLMREEYEKSMKVIQDVI